MISVGRSFATMRWLLLASTVISAGCASKSIILREREQVWFLNQGDSVPINNAVCMDKGTFLATFQRAGTELLERNP